MAVFEEFFDVVEGGKRFDVNWIEFIAFAKDAGVVAGAATSLITLSERINAWRKKMKASRHDSSVQLQRSGAEPLDLGQADDAQVEAWLLDSATPSRNRETG